MTRLSEFRTQLEKAGVDYLMLEPLQPDSAHFCFTGFYQGREIIWNTELIPLKKTNQSRQSFEVGEEVNAEIPLKIILDLPCITEPDVLKSIIMIRNYKRLHAGRHEWSPPE